MPCLRKRRSGHVPLPRPDGAGKRVPAFSLRYLSPLIPFLFVPAAAVWLRFGRRARYAIGLASIGMMWCLAMYRDVGFAIGVLHPVVSTLTAGFHLPVLRTLERTGATYIPAAADGVSPLRCSS